MTYQGNFFFSRGLRQGDPLSPTLCDSGLGMVVRSIRTNPGGTIMNGLMQHIAYPDDTIKGTSLSGEIEIISKNFSRLQVNLIWILIQNKPNTRDPVGGTGRRTLTF